MVLLFLVLAAILDSRPGWLLQFWNPAVWLCCMWNLRVMDAVVSEKKIVSLDLKARVDVNFEQKDGRTEKTDAYVAAS